MFISSDGSSRTSPIRYLMVICCIILYGCGMWLRSSLMAITDALKDTWPSRGNQQDISKLASAFFTTYTLFQIPAGLLLQTISSEIALIIPMFTAGLCSQLIYYCQSFNTLISIRMLLGISCSTCWLATLSMIQQYFSIYDVPFYAGLGLFIGQSGPILGIYQAYLYQHYNDWRTPYFWDGILIEILCLILMIAYLIDRNSIVKSPSITLQNGEIQKPQKMLSVFKSYLLPRPYVVKAYSIANKTKYDEESGTKIDDNDTNNDVEITLGKQIISAVSNPYNYLFALIHSCCCIPQAILGGLWMKEYLQDKFHIDKTFAATIAVYTNIGGALSALLFGFIAKKYQATNAYIYRTLIKLGFVLWSATLVIIYIPAKYHCYSDLLLFSFLSGCGMGAIPIIFSAIRMVNEKTNSSDLSSGLVSTICMANIYLSYEITGKIFSIIQNQNNNHPTEQQYNSVFYYVVCSIFIGFVFSFMVPKNK